MPTVEKYHNCILKCVACHVDINKLIHGIIKSNSSGDISAMQAEFLAREKARLNRIKGSFFTCEQYDYEMSCNVCHKRVSSMQIKICSCKKAYYCSKGESDDKYKNSQYLILW